MLRCDDHRSRPIREVITQRGFKEVYSGKSNNWDVTFDEFSTLHPGSLIVMGYNTDLDQNIRRWMYDYEDKGISDPVTVYFMDLEDAVKNWYLPTRDIEINGNKTKLPFLHSDTTYISLPVERSEAGLFLSMNREIIIPTELMSRMYVLEKTRKRLLKRHLMSYCGASVYYGPRSEPPCGGEMTLPVSLITVKGKSGIEYLYTGQALSENIGTLGKVIGANKNKSKLRHKVDHNRRFVAKHQSLLED